MKKIKYIILCLAVGSIVGCTNYLDVKPQGKVLPKTDDEFAAVLNRRIHKIESGDEEFMIGNAISVVNYEGFTDNFDANISVGQMPLYVGTKINDMQFTVFPNLYDVVKDCNIILEEMGTRSSVKAQQMMAAAYALKGLCYYNLMRNFCEAYDAGNATTKLGIPVIEEFDVYGSAERGNLQATADYTVSLFKKSIELNVIDPVYLFTPDITKALLAKTYFWTEQWDLASDLCVELLAKTEYQLESRENYLEILQDQYKKGQGIILRSYINNGSTYSDGNYIEGSNYSRTRPVSKSMIDMFDADKEKDIRYTITVGKKRVTEKNVCARVRASELCLMLAECYYHMGENSNALTQLNLLRSKRITGVADYTDQTLPPVNSTSPIKVDAKGVALTPLLSAIFDERRKELFLEGDRWFELKRNGTPEMWVSVDGLKYVTKKYLYTFPVNKSDVDLFNLQQNEGYIY